MVYAILFLAGAFTLSMSHMAIEELWLRQSFVLTLVFACMSGVYASLIAFVVLLFYMRRRQDRVSESVWSLRKPIKYPFNMVEAIAFHGVVLWVFLPRIQSIYVVVLIFPLMLSTGFLSRFLPSLSHREMLRFVMLILLPLAAAPQLRFLF